MAEGVNLTSKQWRDLIFEGKNKEFGAYQLRKKSGKRHIWAIIGIIVLLVVVGISVWGYISYQNMKKAEEEALARAAKMREQKQAAAEVEIEEEDEPIIDLPEPEIEEATPVEEAIAQQAVVDVVFKDEPDPDKQMKNVDETLKDESTVGVQNVEGEKSLSAQIETQPIIVAQPTVVEEKKPEPVKQPEPEKVFTAVEQQASFPGGQSALSSWLGKNLRYPELAAQNGISGKVIVQFVVEKDGSITGIKVARGVDKELDREAVRVVSKMPRWQPGKNNGVAVRSQFTLPVTFKLQNQ
ncbi:MAG: TonB family protein [Muribaculaceae bacterium]|nr:TonB family protein [Muribaculaceae bacterium]